MIDCAKDSNAGCDGGDMGSAMDYLTQNLLETEIDYPYKGVD